jgi:hypothetical protein
MNNVKKLFFATLLATTLLFSGIGIIIIINNAQSAMTTSNLAYAATTSSSSDEICNDGIDNNKNGQIDEDCSGENVICPEGGDIVTNFHDAECPEED